MSSELGANPGGATGRVGTYPILKGGAVAGDQDEVAGDQDEAELRKAVRLAILATIQRRAEIASPEGLRDLAQAYGILADDAAEDRYLPDRQHRRGPSMGNRNGSASLPRSKNVH